MRLIDKYKKEIIPALKKELSADNIHEIPKVDKIVISVGLSHGVKEPAFIEVAENTLKRISGQKPVKTLAKKSISNFKIREGMVVGMKVTLRGARMYDFMEKFLKVTLPRVRDFRGLNLKSIDRAGNMSIGLKENLAFPEIKADEIEKIHGVEITFSTTAKNKDQGVALFKALGFPFTKR